MVVFGVLRVMLFIFMLVKVGKGSMNWGVLILFVNVFKGLM